MDDAEKIRAQVGKAGVAGAMTGGGTLFTEPVLIVNQKAKIFEQTSNFAVYTAEGTQIGSVRQVGQSRIAKLLKAFSNFAIFMSARYEIVDTMDAVQLIVYKPRTFIKPRVLIQRPDGTEIGQIKQKIRLGKAKFMLTAPGGEQELATLNAENFRAWNFSITDPNGIEIARLSKTWAGIGKEIFTKADNYVVEMKAQLADPVLSLVVASALTIDQLMKQIKS